MNVSRFTDTTLRIEAAPRALDRLSTEEDF